MLELGPYGSVRGARGNSRPYREPGSIATGHLPLGQPRSPLSPENRPEFQCLTRWLILLASVTGLTSMAMQDQVNATPAPKRVPWNKGKLTGAKPPLRPKHVWSIRTKLQIEGRARDLAMFNLAIDSKLRGCDVVAIRVEDVAA